MACTDPILTDEYPPLTLADGMRVLISFASSSELEIDSFIRTSEVYFSMTQTDGNLRLSTNCYRLQKKVRLRRWTYS